MERFYLDWNATAPLLPEVRDAMAGALDTAWGNASSIHREGQQARSVIERARRAVARAVGAPAQSVVLTGGATEGNNQVLRTHARYTSGAHILSSMVEHPSVVEVLEDLERQGHRVTRLGVDRQGRLDLGEVKEVLGRSEVTLLSVMWANNESGTIYPTATLSALAHEHGAKFHVDGTQALGRIPVDFEACGADFMTLSFHKMGGPKGIGAVVLREGEVLEALLTGGHQERGRRPGTENVLAAVGLEAAARALGAHAPEWHEGLARKRAYFLEQLGLCTAPVAFELRGDQEACLPNTVNVAFEGVGGEDLLVALDLAGVSASSGSACTAGSLEPSHVILAMGYAPEEAKRSLRFSFGPPTTLKELETAAGRIGEVVRRLWALGGTLDEEKT